MAPFQRGGLGGRGGCLLKKNDCCLCLFVSLGCTVLKGDERAGRAVVSVEGRWMVVRKYIPAFVGLGTIVPGR